MVLGTLIYCGLFNPQNPVSSWMIVIPIFREQENRLIVEVDGEESYSN